MEGPKFTNPVAGKRGAGRKEFARMDLTGSRGDPLSRGVRGVKTRDGPHPLSSGEGNHSASGQSPIAPMPCAAIVPPPSVNPES
jgi:hypothetical protein